LVSRKKKKVGVKTTRKRERSLKKTSPQTERQPWGKAKRVGFDALNGNTAGATSNKLAKNSGGGRRRAEKVGLGD